MSLSHATFDAFPPPIRTRMTELHAAAGFRGILPGDLVGDLAPSPSDRRELPVRLLDAAAYFSIAPVSRFHVGAVARGSSGSLYYGANLEFPGESLLHTVHAEQAAVINAWLAGENGIDEIAVTAVPCGSCRQFLNELTTADRLVIALPAGRHTLRELLPDSFGPADLGSGARLLDHQEHELAITADDPLAAEALAAARMSHAPYSKAFAGVALQTRGGSVIRGAYAENAAFNPSVPPLAAALSQLRLRGEQASAITQAVLVTTDRMHEPSTRSLLATVTDAAFRVVTARNSGSRAMS